MDKARLAMTWPPLLLGDGYVKAHYILRAILTFKLPIMKIYFE